MRESDWQIRWNPLGESPEVLLDFGDLMEDEIARQLAASVAVGRFDFAPSAIVTTRKNLKRRLEFSRFIEHDTNGEAVEECSARTLAGPWSKGLISLRHQEGGERLMKAALMGSSHDPDFAGPGPRSLHAYRFRVTPQELVPLGDPVTIIGGWYNPPGNGITIIIPGGSGVVPGGTITIPTGIPGVIPGVYPVGGVQPGANGHDEVTIDVPHDEEPLGDPPSFEFVSSWEASPNGGIPVSYIRGRIDIVTEVTIEAFINGGSGWGWYSYAAGPHTFLSPDYDQTVPTAWGSWNGLTSVSGPRDVTYSSTVTSFRWRRLGDPAENVVGVPVRGEGTVSYVGGDASTKIFDMPAVGLQITADSHSGGAPGTFPGGGIVQPVELP
jgi:hypothetical protein